MAQDSKSISSRKNITPFKIYRPQLKRNTVQSKKYQSAILHPLSISRYSQAMSMGKGSISINNLDSKITKINQQLKNSNIKLLPEEDKEISPNGRLLTEYAVLDQQYFQKAQNDMNNISQQDDLKSIKLKQKKNDTHRYQQKQNNGQIYSFYPKQMPQIVKDYYRDRYSQCRQHQNVNFIHGLLKQIGYVYYAIDDTIYFFQAQTMNKQSLVSPIKTNNQHNLIYGAQVITLKKPYVCRNTQFIAIFHPYLVQFYVLKIKDTSSKQILIQTSAIKFYLPRLKTSSLLLNSNGELICSDQMGKPCKLTFNSDKQTSSITKENKRLSLIRLIQEKKQVISYVVKSISTNMKNFIKSIKNYTYQLLFDKSQIQTSIHLDKRRNLLIILNKSQKIARPYYQILIYGASDLQFYYKIFHQQIIDSIWKQNEQQKYFQIINSLVIDPLINQNYNMVLLFQSGHRKYFDISRFNLRKKIIYSPNLLSQREKFITHLLNQNFYISLTVLASNNFCRFYHNLIGNNTEIFQQLQLQYKNQNQVNQNFNLQEQYDKGKRFYLCAKQLKYLGNTKQTLGNITCPDLPDIISQNELVRQVYYRAQQIYYISPTNIQRSIVLRPIDIFFTIIYEIENYRIAYSVMQLILPKIDTYTLVSFCCQIYVDQEGVYYNCKKLLKSLHSKSSLQKKAKLDYRNNILQEISYNLLNQQFKNRVLVYMQDLAIQNNTKNQQSKQHGMVSGIFIYFSKLLKRLWRSNLLNLQKIVCKAGINILISLRQFLQLVQKNIRCGTVGRLGGALRWVQRFRQLLFLRLTVSKLPEKQIKDHMITDSKEYQQYLLLFFLKYCEPKVVFDLRLLIPYYVNEKTIEYYQLWCSIKDFNAEKVIQVCKQKKCENYFLQFVSNIKKIPQLMLFRNFEINKQQRNKKQNTYQQLIQKLTSNKISLFQRQKLLITTKVRLKYQKGQDYQSQTLRQITDRILIQKLLFNLYNQAEQRRLFRKMNNTNQQNTNKIQTNNKQFINSLQFQLFSLNTLEQCVFVIKPQQPLISLIYVAKIRFHNISVYIRQFFQQITQNQSSIHSILEILKKKIQFILIQGQLLDKLQTFIYEFLNYIVQYRQIEEQLSIDFPHKEDKYNFLSFLFEIGVDKNRLLKFVFNQFSRFKKNEIYLNYLCVSSMILIRDYSQNQIELYLKQIDKLPHNNIIEKILFILNKCQNKENYEEKLSQTSQNTIDPKDYVD